MGIGVGIGDSGMGNGGWGVGDGESGMGNGGWGSRRRTADRGQPMGDVKNFVFLD